MILLRDGAAHEFLVPSGGFSFDGKALLCIHPAKAVGGC